MKRFFYILCCFMLVCNLTGCQKSPEIQELETIVTKLIGPRSSEFEFDIKPANNDYFELETRNNKVVIRANNGISAARGFNHYLRTYCHSSVSREGCNISLPDTLPALTTKEKIEASVPYRYFLNYCTYSYSMPFWSWADWDKEIDWMALQGVNMPLVAVYGQFGVWQNTLRRLGCSEEEIKAFLPGAAYEAWWLMGNLEGFGGPVSDEFINQQTELQQKMLAKMRTLGMQPVFQGFYGMIPNSLAAKYPEAKIKQQGKWIAYQRPAFLDPTDPLFEEIAAIYYEEQKKLFGETKFFGGDPFHEGGITEGIDVKNAAGIIYQNMKKVNPDAVWVLQGWQTNPRKDLLEGLQPGETIILDLMACENPQWTGNNPSFVRPEGHMNHNWIWCALPNFGGKTGLHGKMSSYAHEPYEAAHQEMGRNLCGIGMTPEGLGTIPVVYDMVFDMAWRKDSIVISDWLADYITYRYGMYDSKSYEAWKILSQTIYECHNKAGGPVESFLCARPADEITKVSSWGNALLFYEPLRVAEAWTLLLNSRAKLGEKDTYNYDLVNLTRQVLADYSKYLHKKTFEAFDAGDKESFKKYSSQFLALILDMDELLGSRKEFLLGKWMDDAEQCGTNSQEKAQFKLNAKSQLTTWSDVNSSLHDYANKEWSGLLSDFYYSRWKMYFDYKTALLNKQNAEAPNFPEWEQAWIKKESSYPTEVNGKDPIRLVEDIYQKYGAEILNVYQSAL